VSLDDLVRRCVLPIPQVIKMDIEGAEAEALRGARSLLEQGSPIIFLATHGRDVHEQCVAFLESLGYAISPLVGESLVTDEIVAQRPGSHTP
jgi:hypothetical protein